MDENEKSSRPADVADAFQRFTEVRVASVAAGEKFAAGEHQWLGQRGIEAACRELGISHWPYTRICRQAKDETFKYGELVALSGDFYRTPTALFEALPSPLPWLWEGDDLSDLRRVFKAELDWIESENRAADVGYPEESVALAWNAKAYLELALDNVEHFGWHNMVAYCRYHAEALDLAMKAGNGEDDPTWRRAVFTNAFADHFLTDGFAAGHVRVPRAQIIEWGREQGYDDKLSGALSKLLHDQDGHVNTLHADGETVADGEGLPVRNSLGIEWSTRCDGQLFIVRNDDAPLVAQPVNAVKASVLELFAARDQKVVPDGIYAATKHVPFPHLSAGRLSEKFPANMERKRLDELVESVSWYMKIPWIGPSLRREHVGALLSALPELMGRMREAVAREVGKTPELERRLPAEYIDAFRSID